MMMMLIIIIIVIIIGSAIGISIAKLNMIMCGREVAGRPRENMVGANMVLA